MLAKAVARQPGVGGQEWTRRKLRIAETLRKSETAQQIEAGNTDAAALVEAHVAERMNRIAEWLESPGAGSEGAPRATLLALALRIRVWLQKRLATGDAEVYGAAFAQAQAFTDALSNETRATFSREDARHLLDTVVRAAHGHALSIESAGRVPHVAHPSAVLAPAGSVVFWGFVAGTERRLGLVPWNHAETKALAAAGVVFPDAGKLLATESDAWRRGVLAARERVMFVVPSKVKGAAMSPHPMWDEIRARLGLEDDVATAPVTRHAERLLRSEGLILSSVETIPPLALPEGRGEWTLAQDLFTGEEGGGTSATALTTLVSCPLAWVLKQRAGLRPGAIAKVAEGALLNGNLSHRLVENLFWENAFDLEEDAFSARADAVLEALLHTEAATLLLPGSAFERAQLVLQIRDAMRALHGYLRGAGFRIASVEEPVQAQSALGTLRGRLDLRLMDASGNDAVLDLKWGEASYVDLLRNGKSVQLASYAQALRSRTSDARWPPAAYFALSSGRVLTVDVAMKAPQTVDGASLETTWNRVERTALAVKTSLELGRVFVAATKRALPLLKALDVPEADRTTYFASTPEAPCKYCEYPAICGVAWKGFH
jgi:RecB family exonuclease